MTHPKIAQPDHEVLELIRRRWSPRAFDPLRGVSRRDLLRLFEAARWAPSSGNEQPWRFLVVDRERAPDAHARLAGALTGKNPAWAPTAPVLVLICVRVTLERNESANPHAWYDTGQAVGLLTIQATALGLSVRQMEGFDRERARDACQVPAPFEPAVVMAIGYAGDPGSLELDAHRAAEQKPRSRKRVGDFTFDGQWAVPLAILPIEPSGH